MSECPELRVLAVVRWQLFASLTFKSERLSDRVRESMFLAFCREVENAARVQPQRLLWVCRWENGEQFGRLHIHALIGGLPSQRIHIGTCFQLMRIWERVGGGHPRVRVFDSDTESPDQALAYSVKSLGGDDFYESDKFNRARLRMSDSVLLVWKRKAEPRRWSPLRTKESNVRHGDGGSLIGDGSLCTGEKCGSDSVVPGRLQA